MDLLISKTFQPRKPINVHTNCFSKFRSITFAQLKPRLINVLMNALQVESDAQNTHMLLGGLLLCVEDSAIFEENETNTELYQSSPAPSDTNLLSSGKYVYSSSSFR